MKTNSKKIFAGLLSLTIVPGLVLPITSFAQTESPRNSFCSRIDEIVAPIEQRMEDREGKLEARWDEIDANFLQRVNERSDRLSDYRTTHDANREARYEQLEARATTDLQKQAVAEFKTTVEAAVAQRKATIDSAISALQESFSQSVKVRRDAVKTAMNEFKIAKSTAIEKIKTDCASGVDSTTVRETFRTSMKAAQDKFKSDYQNIAKLRGSFESVRDTRRQTTQAAVAEFRATVERAGADLKAAFEE